MQQRSVIDQTRSGVVAASKLSCLLTLVGAVGCICPEPETLPADPSRQALIGALLDGRCTEYDSPVARLDPEIALYTRQTEQYVWLCLDLPPQSYGMLDLRIESPALPEILNLHVSAQVGEWPANRPETAPDGPLSDQWWNNRGWAANAVALAGIDDAVPKFRHSAARELQLAVERFGRGPWRLWFELRGLGTTDGFREVHFPDPNETGFVLRVGKAYDTTTAQ